MIIEKEERVVHTYTLRMEYTDLHNLYHELLDFTAAHPSHEGWPSLHKLFAAVREHA